MASAIIGIPILRIPSIRVWINPPNEVTFGIGLQSLPGSHSCAKEIAGEEKIASKKLVLYIYFLKGFMVVLYTSLNFSTIYLFKFVIPKKKFQYLHNLLSQSMSSR